jgi:hypothetical protein
MWSMPRKKKALLGPHLRTSKHKAGGSRLAYARRWAESGDACLGGAGRAKATRKRGCAARRCAESKQPWAWNQGDRREIFCGLALFVAVRVRISSGARGIKGDSR